MANNDVGKKRNASLMMSFHAVSLVILAISLLVMGMWVSNRIEKSAIERIGHTTALFVDSFIAPFVLSVDTREPLETAASAELNALLTDTPLGREVVALKIWNSEGMIIHSSASSEIGSVFPIEAGLDRAWQGVVSAEITDLERPEHRSQRELSDHLLETYSPVWEHGTGKVAAVVEFYQLVDAIEDEVVRARRQSWVVVAASILFIYAALSVLFARGNSTIKRQRAKLESQVVSLNNLLDINVKLNKRARAAAARATDLNERYLRRIAADLHDGPAQDISYSLLTIDRNSTEIGNVKTIATSLERALGEIRSISSGLQSPELEDLSVNEIIRRAVRIHSNRTHAQVEVVTESMSMAASLASKIALFRVLQEALSNSYRHAGDAKPRIEVSSEDGMLKAEIADRGAGHGEAALSQHGTQLGLQIMRERIELLGGEFEVEELDPEGTVVRAKIPFK